MTFTRLTLGEPRLKGRPKGGPQGPGGCDDNLVEGQILSDPGIETAPENEGPSGEDFPFLEDSSWPFDALWWDGSDAGTSRVWGVHDLNVLESALETTPQLSSANPRSGSKHVRITATGGDVIQNYMIPLRGVCVSNELVGVASCRVNAGQLLSMSFWLMETSADIDWYPFIWGEFYDSSGNEITSSFSDGNIDGGVTVASSYTQNTYDIVAPSGAHWAAIRMGATPDGLQTSEVTHHIDMDDFSVTVTV